MGPKDESDSDPSKSNDHHRSSNLCDDENARNMQLGDDLRQHLMAKLLLAPAYRFKWRTQIDACGVLQIQNLRPLQRCTLDSRHKFLDADTARALWLRDARLPETPDN